MQGNPYTASIVGALRYLAESGLWPYFVGFVLMVVLGCWLAPRDNSDVRFFD